jgi:hypothetical protein
MTTVNGLLGGVTSFVRSKMQRDEIYDEFIQVTKTEYTRVFGQGPLRGSDVTFCLPEVVVPDTGLVDFTTCS